jgi:hypothetical protein
MKTVITKILLLSFGFILMISKCHAQNGLDSIIVEKYYISNAADSLGSVGILPVGSITYRIFVDMKQGYTFQMAYGSATHPLQINTTTAFFNNEDYGATTPSFSKTNASKNTVMLDSWLSAGAACVGNYGVLKSEDNGVANVSNFNGILHNTDPAAGIPLTTQDGLIAGTPGSIGTIGIDTEIAVFDAISQLGNSFSTINGAWYCLAGAVGPDTTNKVLIAQLTTKGKLTFKLNIQLGTPTGGTEIYVADNPTGTEIQRNDLTYISDTTPITAVNEIVNNSSISIFPNPSNGIYHLNVSDKSQSLDNYYTIYDLLGTTLLKKKIFSDKEIIDLSSFTDGIYFIEFSLNGVLTTRKLIKN